MDSSILKKAGNYLSEQKKKSRLKKLASALAVVIMLGTVFVLAMPASTLEKEAYCGIEEHAHTKECYEEVLICGLEENSSQAASGGETAEQGSPLDGSAETAGHRHDDTCYTETKTLVCGQEEDAGHRHGDDCYTVTESKELVCTLEESEEHAHEDGCYETVQEQNLACGLEEGAGAHRHEDGCYEVSRELTCGLEESGGTENDSAQNDLPAETPEGQEVHTHTEECYELKEICGTQEHEHTQECYDETYSCGMREHTHDAACSQDGSIVCGMQEHTHIQRCRMSVFCENKDHVHEYECYIGPEVSEEDRERIIKVDGMIDALPTFEEIEAELAKLDDAGDIDGYEAYFLNISFQAGTAYAHFEDLKGTVDLQNYVVNSEDLMKLSSLWEAAVLDTAETESAMIYSINQMGSVNKAALVYGDSGTLVEKTGASFAYWTAVVAEREEGCFVIKKVIPSGSSTAEEKKSLALTEDRLLLFFYEYKPEFVQEGYYVKADFDYKKVHSGCEPNGYGTVTFSPEKLTVGQEKPPVDNQLKPIASAETKDIVEINLYDYGTNINELYGKDGDDKRNYPGFQQSGGAKYPIELTNTWGGGYNFGDNITTDRETGYTEISKGDVNNKTNNINGYLNGSNVGMYANSPMKGTLDAEGYPALDSGTSLKYLFSESAYAKKMNGAGLDGLFQYNAETGEYFYDSRKNHAELDGNRFLLYDALLSPNFIMYPFGNFMPFNKINTETTPASKMDRSYFENMAEYARYRGSRNESGLGTRYEDLAKILDDFVDKMDEKTGTTDWTAKTALDQYFSLPGKESDDSWVLKALNKVYSIDYDVPKNFFFGMTMEMNYIQPKGGMTGPQNKYPMVFDFAGDDDVWVYVDGNLMLDLSGIHRHVGGTIDFREGTVTYYGYDGYAKEPLGATIGKDVGGAKETFTFEEVLTKAIGAEEAHKLLKYENGKYTTFQDYSAHNFKFYYMERGAGSGVCRINFNFPVIPKNSIAVGKEMNFEDGNSALGNPSFEFQVLKEGADGTNLSEDLFVKPRTSYEIYENGIQTGRTGTVDEHGVIRLKAGEMAVISGVEASQGRYFVRELLDERIFEQYGASIKVDGMVGSGDELADVEIDNMTFKGIDSPVKNIDAGAVTLFQFVNNVEITKTGSLSVTKKVNAGKEEWKKTFAFEITLDGQPLPEGTKYTVGNEERTVEQEGLITLKAEETAVIGNILAGSRYTVKETASSAEGFKDVSYSVEPEKNGEVIEKDGKKWIQGIIQHKGESAASVTVVNSKDAFGSLVIEKRIADQKEEYVEGESFSYRVYLESLASGRLEPYSGPYYLKDADGYYYTPDGKTEITDADSAQPFGSAEGGIIANVVFGLRIEITKIPSGSNFYVEEITKSLAPDRYGDPEKEVTDTACGAPDDMSDAEQKISSDGTVLENGQAQVVITNRLLNWQMIKRSATSGELLLEGAEFVLIREGETEPAYRGISGEGGVLTWKNADGEAVGTLDIEAGTYTMEEVKAPAGYAVSGVCWILKFGSKGSVPEVTCKNTENPDAETKVEPTVVKDDAGDNWITFYFDNEVLYRLPNAGGSGIYWYSIGGTLLMAAAALILYKMRCRKPAV